VPVYDLSLSLGTERKHCRNIAVEDLPSSKSLLLQDDDFNELDALLIDERDRRLIRNIASLDERTEKIKRTVALLFGAMHMRNVTSFFAS